MVSVFGISWFTDKRGYSIKCLRFRSLPVSFQHYSVHAVVHVMVGKKIGKWSFANQMETVET